MNGMRPATQFLACWLAAAAAGSAQTIDLSSPDGVRRVDGAAAGARFGASLHMGDLTGDFDHKKLIVGAPDEDAQAGVVRVFRRAAGGTPLLMATAAGGAAGDRFGAAVDAGFVTREEMVLVNGRPPAGTPVTPRDLIVGAPGAAGGRGEVYVFASPIAANVTAADAAIRVIGAQPGDAIGGVVDSADLNGDGYRELILASPSRGRVYVLDVHNAPSPAVDLAAHVPGTVISGLGGEIALATGDLTGDGIFDLAIGDPDAQSTRGRVYLLLGARAPLPAARDVLSASGADARITGVDAGDRVGTSLWVADVSDGSDEASDLVIGAPGADTLGNARPDAGEVFVIWGRADLASNFRVGLLLLGAAPGHRLGARVTAGDINRDNPDDITMLAPGANGGKGEIHVYFGRHDYEFTDTQIDLASEGSRRVVADPSGGTIETIRVWEATGEGAEEILAGVPSSAAGAAAQAGRLYIALSPRFDFSSGSVTLSSGEGGVASGSLQVLNSSQVPIAWSAAATAPWIALGAATGSSSAAAPFMLALTAAAEGLSIGTHHAQIRFSSMDDEVRMTIAVGVALTITESRHVAVEAPASGASVPQPFTVRGWAIDTGAPSGTGVDHVEIYAYPDPGSGQPPVLLGTATYGGARPDVGAAYGGRFAASGFELTPGGIVPGAYQLVVRARSAVTGAYWSKPAGAVTLTVQRVPSGDDLDGDGATDLLWMNTSTGAVAAWLMDGITRREAASLTPAQVPASWRLGAFRDFNADGHPDLLWHDGVTGALTVWFMNGRTRTGTATPSPAAVSPSWRLAATADFNGDGELDWLWRHQAGNIGVWLMNGLTQAGTIPLSPSWVSPTWDIAGVGDFNGDGQTDLVWRHRDGNIGVWIMDGARYDHPVAISPVNIAPAWRLAAIADMNGDGKPDFVWHHQTLGNLGVWLLDGVTRTGVVALTPNSVSPIWSLVGPR